MYDFLRALVKNPFTLDQIEKTKITEFLKKHGVENSDWDWFLAVCTPSVQLATTEINVLIKIIDDMENLKSSD